MKNKHLQDLTRRYPDLTECSGQIMAAFKCMQRSFRGGGKLLLCGNGGSAADAEHWAGELLKGFVSNRPLDPMLQERLGPDLGPRLQRALPVIPLSGFPSLASAFANDVAPQLVFAQLVLALAEPRDTVVGITTSGNSENVCQALRTATAIGVATVGLTGPAGGRIARLADVCIRVPGEETFLVQERHLPVYHTLCMMLEDAFFPDTGTAGS